MGKHLNYAVTTALGSESIRQHWSEENQIVQDILAKAKKRNQLNAGKTTRNAKEANFDKQKGLKINSKMDSSSLRFPESVKTAYVAKQV